MRVLFDQAIPVPIRTFLIGHTVRTAAQQHWDTLKNGELLTVAAVNAATPGSFTGGYSGRLTPKRHLEAKFVAAHTDRSSLVAQWRAIPRQGLEG